MSDIKLSLDKIKTRGPREYDQLIGALSLTGIHTTTGEVTITESQWQKLSAMLGGKVILVLQAMVKEETPHEKYCGCEDCFQKHVAENNAKEKERLALASQAKAAAARLLQYMREQGLRDNEHNRSKWAEFESKLPKDVQLSADLIDQFISGWRSVLEWDTPSAPAPSPAPEPEPVFLSDGSPQRSLDETPSRSWTKAQLQDWFKRSDGQKKLFQQQFGGGIRGSFFKPDSQVV